jgi:hypothetical protein
MVPSTRVKAKKPLGRIYVVASLGHLRGEPVGARTWWCVEPGAEPDEISVMYVIRRGFALLFRYIGPAEQREGFCALHGMETGEIEILGKLPVPLSYGEIRAHRVLKNLPAVRRSFQSRSFRLDQPYYASVCKLFDYSQDGKA